MRMIYPYFNQAIDSALSDIKKAPLIHPASWQGLDMSKRPEAKTHELLNYDFSVTVGNKPLSQLQEEIKPNLPWADDHFLERVCGEPINPGEQWKHWPWGNSADKFRDDFGKVMSPSDWAYLAGMIDGDGSFSIGTSNQGSTSHPRIKITQVNGPFVESLYKKFKVGTYRPYSSPGNKLSDNISHIWRISAREEVRWVLKNTIPYLILKKKQAQELLNTLPEKDGRFKEAQPLHEPMFNHNYMERYWAASFPKTKMMGIRYPYGDLNDVVDQIANDPTTRQAYLPVFFPEDTGAVHKGRVPCSLGYHFIQRGGYLHINYYLRSCEAYRHFRDDIYLTVRLLLWMADRLKEKGHTFTPGIYSMYMTSFHLFVNDKDLLP